MNDNIRSSTTLGSFKFMTVTVSLTLAKETELFNEKVINKIYKEITTTADIINATGGSPEREAYQSLLPRYTKESTGQITAGGRHTPFLYFFPVSDLTTFIIKPYHAGLREIANHYVAVEDVNTIYRNHKFKLGDNEIKIIFSDVFGLGTFTVEQKTIPFIVQRYSNGTKLTEVKTKEAGLIISFLPEIFKHLAKEGVIVDPYNRNWFAHGFSLDYRTLDYELLEYVDLGFMHSLDTNHKVQAVIESLKTLNF